MQQFLHVIESNQAILVALVTVTYAFAFKAIVTLQRRRRRERRDGLYVAVSSGLTNGTITVYQDMVDVYKGIMKLGSDDLTYRVGLSSFLRDLLVEIVSGKMADKQNQIDAVGIKNTVTAFLRQSEQESPYSDLPDVERSIINDINGFLTAGDNPSVLRKLEELASSIQVRAQEQARIEKLNRLSIPLAACGLILTIFFGFLSLR